MAIFEVINRIKGPPSHLRTLLKITHVGTRGIKQTEHGDRLMTICGRTDKAPVLVQDMNARWTTMGHTEPRISTKTIIIGQVGVVEALVMITPNHMGDLCTAKQIAECQSRENRSYEDFVSEISFFCTSGVDFEAGSEQHFDWWDFGMCSR